MERGEGSQWVKRTGGRAREDWGRTLEELEAGGTVLPSFHGQSAGEGLVLERQRDENYGELRSRDYRDCEGTGEGGSRGNETYGRCPISVGPARRVLQIIPSVPTSNEGHEYNSPGQRLSLRSSC